MPYCGERPEIEFRHGGEAHIARPARSRRTVRCRMGGLPLQLRDNPKGLHVERWRHVHGCGRFFNAVREHVSDCFAGHLQGRAKPPPRVRAGNADDAFRLPTAAASTAARRCASRFDGAAYEGFAGDTLASALLANGVHLVGRSFKYHRPRGILAAGADEPNALVTVVARRRARRRICARRRSSSTRARRPKARTAGRRSLRSCAPRTISSRR